MFKNKKRILIIIIILICIYLAIYVISIFPKGKKYENTVFIGDTTKVTVKDGKISVYNEDKKLLNQKAKIYFKKKFIDGYLVSKESESTGSKYTINALNDKNETLILERTLIACTNDVSIDVINVTRSKCNDLSILYSFLDSNNTIITTEFEVDYFNVSTFDLDDDGTNEYVYSAGLISYDFGEDVEEDTDEIEEDDITLDESEIEFEEYDSENDKTKYVSLIFFEKDGKYFLINTAKSTYDENYNCFEFLNPIDFNNDGNYEFTVLNQKSEYGPYYYELYNFDGKTFTKIGGR